ncbi:MAG: hypothetical protein LLG00_12250 [Planctomycetaceae bacterium]|nr:hypothetical protein [Planctomycetaceae bacterium]
MSQRMSREELSERKRELHRRIGRSRRRIDSRLAATKTEAERLVSWRTYVARHPAWSIAAALGAGITASGVVRRGRLARWLGSAIVRRALAEFKRQIWKELQRTWRASGQDEASP